MAEKPEKGKHQVNSSNSVISLNKDNLLTYPFYFRRSLHKLLLDTGAERSLVSEDFVNLHRLVQICTSSKQLIMADKSRVLVNRRIDSININLGYLTVKIEGLICPNLNIDIIAGMDWL